MNCKKIGFAPASCLYSGTSIFGFWLYLAFMATMSLAADCCARLGKGWRQAVLTDLFPFIQIGSGVIFELEE